MEEFHVALTYNVEIKHQRLIAVMSSQCQLLTDSDSEDTDVTHTDVTHTDVTHQLLETGDAPASSSVQFDDRYMCLKTFTDRHTYIDLDSREWKERLMYAMPVKRLGNVESHGRNVLIGRTV